jgi:hypothetical protein
MGVSNWPVCDRQSRAISKGRFLTLNGLQWMAALKAPGLSASQGSPKGPRVDQRLDAGLAWWPYFP